MERWRSFFTKSGEDVWTIIEQAILVAAHDHPREFKQKRCEIAETLFATRHHQNGLAASRLNASVITKCINRMDVGEGEARDSQEISAVLTKVEAFHGAEQLHNERCSDELQGYGVDACESLYNMVCGIKEIFEDSMQPDGAVLCALKKLASLHITVEVLKETEIGKHVNILRKHSCEEIRSLARVLVRCWKELVDDWVNRAGTSVDVCRDDMPSERDNEEEGRISALCDGEACISNVTPTEVHRPFQSRGGCVDVPEERGSSSRAEVVEVVGVGLVERPHFNDSYSDERDSLQDGTITDAEGLRRDRSSRASFLTRSFGVAKHKSNADKPNGNQIFQRPASAVMQHQKLVPRERVHSEEKGIPGGKRKPQDELLQMDNAKRKQGAHSSGSRKIQQTGLMRSKEAGQNRHRNQVRI